MTGLDNETLIDALLKEQRELTAVDRFSARHDAAPDLQGYYRDLLPLSAPTKGEQYAFEVDLDSCSGCKACVTACHNLNGLDADETWRDIGQLLTGPARAPVVQTVTTACHHCAEPGCASGCPVRAYEKDEATGIVRHLDDQCIGCQYCSMMCPYDVPKYSKSRGIVRKCDMCYSRLAEGEAPACVQGCPNGAITIRVVTREQMKARALNDQFLTGAPSPTLTIPGTIYSTSRSFIDGPLWGEDEAVTPAADHWPLVGTLVLMQFSAGIFLVELLSSVAGNPSRFNLVAALSLCMMGMGVSMSHLGRPLGAWRWFLGLGTSWLSREIGAFSLYAMIVAGCVTLPWEKLATTLRWSLWTAGIVIAIATIHASARVYSATGRGFWSWRFVAGRFFGTAALLGTAACWASSLWSPLEMGRPLAVAMMIAALWKLGVENPAKLHGTRELRRSWLLLNGPLGFQARVRQALLLAGGVFGPFLGLIAEPSKALAIAALVSCVIGEVMERRLFFRAVSPDKMPGVS